MKKYFLIIALFFLSAAKSTAYSNDFSLKHSLSAFVTEYETNVTFPAGYAVGDYIEFLKVSPHNAGASGYYQISISYTRNNVASAATHLAAISHANPAVWRETGRINNNPYVGTGVNVTVDCNTEYANPRFRIRAINTLGTTTQPLTVNIKVISLNITWTYTALNNTGSDLTVSKFQPMTSDWDLYVGDVFSANGASLAIKAIKNGNVGIGTSAPDEKLTVNGNIHAKEVRIDTSIPVPDYVFANDYKLKTLQEVEAYIKQNSHLPEIPSAKEIEKNGLMLAEMNMALLKKMEEMTLYMIEQNKKSDQMMKYIETQNKIILQQNIRFEKLEGKKTSSK